MKRSDHWVWLRNTFALTVVVVLIGFAAAPRVGRAACIGDCGNTGTVTVTDIVTMVDIALQTAQLSACTAGDANNDKVITVDEILQAVNNAITGKCGGPPPGCGNGVVEASLNEECDDGGTCLGGSDAGKHCTAESDCSGTGVCKAGTNAERACDPTNPNACPGSTCQKCIPQGGDGCAANCTLETTILMPLVPGQNPDPTSVKAGTSGSTVWNGVLGPLGLAMLGGQTLVVGKEKDNEIPVVVTASYINQIDVAALACSCVRGIADMTCGGTLFEVDGTTLATDCTPRYVGGICSDNASPQPCTTLSDCSANISCVGGFCADCRTNDDCNSEQTCVSHACDGKNPCALVHGLGGSCSVTTTKTCGSKAPCPNGETCVQHGNVSSGVIECATGLKGTNMLMAEDSAIYDNGVIVNDPPPCDYTNSDTFVSGSTFPECAQDPVVTLSDQNPAPVGAALVLNSTAIGNYSGTCNPDDPNRPAGFCTDQEDYSTRGTPVTLPAVTGSACAEMTNIPLGGATTNQAVCKCQDPTNFSCPASQCNGPECVSGSPIPSCSQLTGSSPTASGLGLAGAFTTPSDATIGDIVVTDLLQAGTWTTLAASISATDTTITLVDASTFPSSGIAGIENEEIQYSGKSGNQLTGLQRAVNDTVTTAVAHAAGVPVVH